VSGLADACSALEVPVVGGNVSLYNETEQGPIYPTPVVGMVGELPDPARVPGIALSEGHAIALVGPFAPSLAGSELAKVRGELGPGLPSLPVPEVTLAIFAVRAAVRHGTVTAAHDISDGGLACAVAEMAIAGGVGAHLDLDPLIEARGCSGESALFGEGPGGFLVAAPRADLEILVGERDNVILLGEAGGDRLELEAAESSCSVLLADAERAWRSLAERMQPETA
jgi:phosphoribosylformylglycinamidine synthase